MQKLLTKKCAMLYLARLLICRSRSSVNFQYNRSIVEVFGRSGRRAGPHDAVDKTFEV